MKRTFTEGVIRSCVPECSGVYWIIDKFDHINFVGQDPDNLMNALLRHHRRESQPSSCIWRQRPVHFR